MAFLVDRLREGWAPAAEIRAAAAAVPIEMRTLERARKRLGVRVAHVAGADAVVQRVWEMPDPQTFRPRFRMPPKKPIEKRRGGGWRTIVVGDFRTPTWFRYWAGCVKAERWRAAGRPLPRAAEAERR